MVAHDYKVSYAIVLFINSEKCKKNVRFSMFSLSGLPTFDNANSTNATLIVRNVGDLSASAFEFLNSSNSSGVEIVNDLASVMGDIVCRADGSIRDEIAGGSPLLIINGSGMNGTFTDGSAQCGDCGKLYRMLQYYH